MPMINNMTVLLDKIERRLGTKLLNLPEQLSKDKWASEVIENETLDTFSRFFPRKVPYVLGPQNQKVMPFGNPFTEKWYIIDETISQSLQILGAGDIDWHAWSSHYPGSIYGGINSYDMLTTGVDFETFGDIQMMADHTSAFSAGIYIEFVEPNMIKLNIIISANFLSMIQNVPINLFVKHASNLKTISPTKMETFERLATADIATFLFQNLKMFDGIETVFSNIDLKLSTLEEEARKRDDIIQELKTTYVSAENKNQPVMFTIN